MTATRDQVAGTWSCAFWNAAGPEKVPGRQRLQSTGPSAHSQGRRTQITEDTVFAARTAGPADLPPEKDQAQAETTPLGRGHQLVQLELCLDRVGLAREPQAAGHPAHVDV